ncbi:MAG: hypothetical protein HOK81_09870, partial [Rhodospirillaceae bacterium]|nr:hypothetical protein [Rhodospirillaceae bacterium]
GKDAQGRAVAPADLGGGLQWRPPETFTFDITIDPIDYQRRRQLQKDREALAQDVAANAEAGSSLQTAQVALDATAESLATTQAGLEAEEATTLATFEAAAQTIVDNTGGASPTAAQLTARSTQLEQLENNTFDDPSYVDLRERKALNAQAVAENEADQAVNAQALASNEADAATLATDAADLDAEAASIESKGTSGTLTVGTVTFKDGRAYLDGRPLDSSGQAELEAACREALGG